MYDREADNNRISFKKRGGNFFFLKLFISKNQEVFECLLKNSSYGIRYYEGSVRCVKTQCPQKTPIPARTRTSPITKEQVLNPVL